MMVIVQSPTTEKIASSTVTSTSEKTTFTTKSTILTTKSTRSTVEILRKITTTTEMNIVTEQSNKNSLDVTTVYAKVDTPIAIPQVVDNNAPDIEQKSSNVSLIFAVSPLVLDFKWDSWSKLNLSFMASVNSFVCAKGSLTKMDLWSLIKLWKEPVR